MFEFLLDLLNLLRCAVIEGMEDLPLARHFYDRVERSAIARDSNGCD
jgi:hypothetical protein